MGKKDALVEYIVQEVVGFLMTDRSIEIDEAMNLFYNASAFEKLQDVETGLYLEGSAYVYDILKEELDSCAD